MPEPYHRIHLGCLMGRNVTGEEGHCNEEQGNRGKRRRVNGLDAIEQASQKTCGPQRAHNADADAQRRQSESSSHHEFQHILRLSSKGYPDADLMRALRYRVSDYAVE